MISFWWSFGLAYLAASLLSSGTSHLLRFDSFRDLLRTHAIIPRRLSAPVALVTLLAELAAGTAALVLLPLERVAAPAMLLFGGTAALGLCFVLYVRLLLGRPGQAVACGCSPLSAPLTPVSVLPGAALVVVSVTALAAAVAVDRLAGAPSGELVAALNWFPALYGATLAVVVMLVPASAPSPAPVGRW